MPKKKQVPDEPQEETEVITDVEVIEYTDLDVVEVPVGQLRPNTYNPNQQNVAAFDLLVKSMEETGFTLPIIVNSGETHPDLKDMIIDGEHRWRAAMVLSMPTVAVVYKDFDEAAMRVSTIRHNRARGQHDAVLEASVLSNLVSKVGAEEVGRSLNVDDVELRVMLKVAEDYTTMEDVTASIEGELLDELTAQGLTGDDARIVAHRHAMTQGEELMKKESRETMSDETGQRVRFELIYSGDQADFMRETVAKYGNSHDAILALVSSAKEST